VAARLRQHGGAAAALTAFYGGPVWRAHRDAANDTMVDSDDVLLLRPVGATGGFVLPPRRFEPTPSIVAATIYHRDEPVDDEFIGFFDDVIAPFMVGLGAPPVGSFATLAVRNNFPALPVRTKARVFVWFAVFADDFEARAHERALRDSDEWHDVLLPKTSYQDQAAVRTPDAAAHRAFAAALTPGLCASVAAQQRRRSRVTPRPPESERAAGSCEGGLRPGREDPPELRGRTAHA